MSHIEKRWYKGRVALNVLAKDIANAKEIFEAAEGHVLVGVLSKNYASVEEAVAAMKQYGEAIDEAVSIGLGAGDNRQAAVVAEIAKHYPGSHINQVFPAVGATRANLGAKDSWINSLVSPCGPILRIALEGGVPQVIPHVYSSIIDKDTGNTNIMHVRTLTGIMKKLADDYA
ncbi:hypothetical protein BGX30_007400 [Mortierella sp. GBA39]|nr:hypothetical protein BGX30_007400 [Mortierella sp. GBA39]